MFPSASLRKLVLAVAALLCACSALTAPASAAPSTPADAIVSLKHPSGLHAYVRAVSDPRSLDYRDYLPVEQVASLFGAPHQRIVRVTKKLRKRGLVVTRSQTGTFLLVGAHSQEKMARALGTPPATPRSASSSRQVPVPKALADDVSAITLVSSAPVAQTAQAAPTPVPPTGAQPGDLAQNAASAMVRTGTPQGCTEGVNANADGVFYGFTPNQYTTAYGHTQMYERGFRGQGQRISLVEIDGFNPADVSTFAQCFGKRVPPIKTHLVGIPAPLEPSDETTLDLEVLSAAAPGLEAIDVYEGNDDITGILATANAALGTPRQRPNVISISLGICEPNFFSGYAQAHALDDVFATASAAGISVLASTGDQGWSACSNRDKLVNGISVNAPASSPFVTAVGGTNTALNADNTLAYELAWNDAPGAFGSTGGGISIAFDKPWWQKGVRVRSTDGLQVTTRTVPDIAALADILPGYAIYCTAQACASEAQPNGGWVTVGGTSAATPLMAAGVALANQQAAKRGQRPLGLINPLVYQIGKSKRYGQVINDVTQGTNDVGQIMPTDTGGGKPMGLYEATKGYDVVTGWGSLKIAAFADTAQRLGQRNTK